MPFVAICAYQNVTWISVSQASHPKHIAKQGDTHKTLTRAMQVPPTTTGPPPPSTTPRSASTPPLTTPACRINCTATQYVSPSCTCVACRRCVGLRAKRNLQHRQPDHRRRPLQRPRLLCRHPRFVILTSSQWPNPGDFVPQICHSHLIRSAALDASAPQICHPNITQCATLNASAPLVQPAEAVHHMH